MKRALIVGVLLLAPPAFGQGLELQAGASSILNADGASVIWSTSQFATEADVGVAGHTFVYGGGFHFMHRGCDIFLGDHQAAYTTIVSGLSAASRGVAIECKTKTRSIQIFSGATGDLHSTPYFTTEQSRHFGSGVQVSQILGDWTVTGVSAFAGGDRVLLEEVQYAHERWRAAEAGGLANGQRYFEGAGTYSGNHIAVNLTHADYFGVARLNSEQASFGVPALSVFVSAFQSKFSGEAAGVTVRPFNWLSGTMMHLISGKQNQTSEFITETKQHWMLTQAINGKSVAFGGGHIGNLLSEDISYQEVFVPIAGFQRAMTVSIRMQLSRGTVNASVNVLPSGVFYTANVGAVVQGPALGGNQSNSHVAP